MSFLPDVIGSEVIYFPSFVTRQISSGQNAVQRIRKSSRPRWRFALTWKLISEADAISFDSAIRGVTGSSATFDWFDWVSAFHWIWVAIGTGTGSSATYTIPGKATSSQQFYYGNSNVISPGTITVGGGSQGEDTVVLNAPSGSLIWANFFGRRRFTVRLLDPRNPIVHRLDPDGYYSLQLKLVGSK